MEKKIKFHTTKKRVVYDRTPFTAEMIKEALEIHRPTQIYHGGWSTKHPFIEITEYNKNGFKMFCHAASNKTPKQSTPTDLVKDLKYQGLEELYFLIP